ncbi:protein-L-isoaspartate O-methyltransferase [Bradyrhizobium sp. AUGA SZCCT0240]|uniref:protein-L-isoaspartate O-methyltransferase family protein n=1 Tax=unclassified Bradyrhizobium TaxID=2631580 RepID=UPI001BA7DF52|nr:MULTISPECIES: protein-L-isoaspartate O-methyltransferase [unclassified Bradyrhizobium]MBR1188870.1 protein-L-isoaspartate O-methyltransferase [Bradyrhizobium sp. AUGA SZCCT0160]MBR1201076.1 protein-L-isoaspartate O-methyltransferase [Bradyrhizobium sp. AUGA SZCCT0158]MBR1245208.1 protein-L-isoaspartate O-methyltransferase [Bradyrhizobium sp. AUGA SZCCT0274]MBR1250025.1 protein-L-isoaspartate O-methyltransferase [Bradyrhizobium sp. AUGA SZCCT0169]MBR1258900.1 protein-L-isoaspartate O-methylt
MSGFSTARQKMVDGQVRPSDVTDIRIIDAMLAVPRETFVPENKRALAYLDLDLEVGEGASEKQFLIQPAVLAKMLQAAEIKETDNVLVVGCASGYAAAVIGKFARQVHSATGADGDPARAPFDVIVLNGATEVVPQKLYGQLRDGGRLVGVFAMSQPQRATIVTRSHGDFGNRALFDAAVPVLPGMERLPAFVF